MMLTASCTAPAGRLQITARRHESLPLNPKAYQRLEIVPIWFTTSAYRYSGLTSSELMQIGSSASQKTAAFLAATITNRGYQVVGETRVLCGEDDLAAFDAETRQLLDAVRVEFWWLTQSVRTEAGAGTSGLPFRYKLKAPLLRLQEKLGAAPVDALVLVDSTVLVETSTGRGKRLLWNWTGAPLVTIVHSPAFGSGQANTNAPGNPAAVSCPATIEHTLAIVDPRTQDVLLWTSVRTPGANVRESVDLRVTVFDLLSALPLIEPPPEPQ
jgi:hypothetical protein